MKLEKYGTDNNTLFIKDASSNIETAFNDAKTKIEELKKLMNEMGKKLTEAKNATPIFDDGNEVQQGMSVSF